MPRLPHHRFALRSLAPSAIRLAPAVGLALAVLAAAPAAAQAPADPTAETTPTPADVRGNGLQFVGVRSGESPAPAARLGVRGEGFEGLAIVLENADGEPVATAAGTSAAVLMTGPAEARVPWTAADAAPGAYRLRVRGLGPGRTLVEDEIGFEVGPAEPIPFRAGFPVATPPQLEAGVAEPLGLEVDGQPEAGEDLLVVAWDPERLEMREGFTHVLKAPPFEIDGEKLATLDPGAVELQVMQRRDGEVLGIAKRPIEVVTELQEAAAAGVLPGRTRSPGRRPTARVAARGSGRRCGPDGAVAGRGSRRDRLRLRRQRRQRGWNALRGRRGRDRFRSVRVRRSQRRRGCSRGFRPREPGRPHRLPGRPVRCHPRSGSSHTR